MVAILKTGYGTREGLKITLCIDSPHADKILFCTKPIVTNAAVHLYLCHVAYTYNSIGLLEQIPPTTIQNILIQKHVVL